jgi:hypothetical protein
MATATVMDMSLTLSPPSLTLLRLLPLLGTTASMTHAYMELVTISSFYRTPPTMSLVSRNILSKTEHVQETPRLASAESEVYQEAEVEKAKDVVIPIWFVTWFNTAVWSVIALNNITTFSALANVFLFPGGLGESKKLYIWGLVAAVGHYAFVPGVSVSVGALFRMCVERKRGESDQSRNGSQSGRAVKAARKWIGVHKVRMATVDLAALLCFGFGVVGVLSQEL